MAVKMPKTIRLAGRRVRMIMENPTLNYGLQGVHCSWSNKIALNSGMADDQIKATAVHEIVHDLEELVGVGMSEKDVTAFSSVLFAALRDNPDLVRWLMDKGR